MKIFSTCAAGVALAITGVGAQAQADAGDEAANWLVSGELQLRGIGEPVLVYEPTGGAEVRQPAR